MDRAIVYLDMPYFFVECERLANNKLRGKPLLIGGGKDRGYVLACSSEAYQYGVRVSMPTAHAMKLCPQAHWLQGDSDLYTRKSQEISEIIGAQAPVYEKASIQSFYLDLSGIDRFFGCFSWTKALSHQLAKEVGLAPCWTLSVNKTVSKIGTMGTVPQKPLYIEQPQVRPFLNPLPIQRLPKLKTPTFQLLSRIGIRKIGALASMPPVVVQKVVGQGGSRLWQRANGVDQDPVKPYHDRKEFSLEHDFEKDCIDLTYIRSKLLAMVEQLTYRLRTNRLLTSKIVLKVKYNNLDTETKQAYVAYTSLDQPLKQKAVDLFERLYYRRMRLIRIGLRFSDVVQGTSQISLFDNTSEQLAIYQTMDTIRAKYGMQAIHTSSALSQ